MSCACYEYLVGACITAKMTTNTVGLLILFCLTSGHGQAPNHPKPSESSTAYVSMYVFQLNMKFESVLQITRFAQGSPNTQIYPTSYYMETTDPGMFQCECLICHDIVPCDHSPLNVSDTLYLDYGSGNMLYAYQLGQYADYGTRNYLIRDDLGTSFQYFE